MGEGEEEEEEDEEEEEERRSHTMFIKCQTKISSGTSEHQWRIWVFQRQGASNEIASFPLLVHMVLFLNLNMRIVFLFFLIRGTLLLYIILTTLHIEFNYNIYIFTINKLI